MEMHSRSRKLLLYSLLSILFALTRSHNFIFDFPYFNSTNFTLLGDSHLKDGIISLTKEATNPSSSSGSITYNNPIRFSDKSSNSTASFSTRFTFSIGAVNAWSTGGGLSFFVSPDNHTLGSPGSFLGLVNSSHPSDYKFFAVEFDTVQDLHFDDPDENHLGLDLGTLFSTRTVSAMLAGINLKSGFSITSWIDYDDSEKKLQVFLSYSVLKPDKPLMVVDIDLSDYLKEFMFVGFSASTDRSTELHHIENWSFQTFGFGIVDDDNNNSVPLKQTIRVSRCYNGLSCKVIVICVTSLCTVLMVLICWVSIKKLKGMKLEEILDVKEPIRFGYKELKSATGNFSSSNIISHGASATIYKAFLKDPDDIAAVKRLKQSHESKTEFETELSTIAKLSHKNLLRLQGWCVEKGELFLVQDFMPNGSLEDALYQRNKTHILKWPKRYNIAVELASVLTYLHSCEQQVIHRDLKTSNVMMDSSYNAKLGDFGLGWMMNQYRTKSMEYLAPEYILYGQATEKSDVYSFGVVVLELACGRRPIERDEEMVNLVDWVWGLYNEGRITKAADKRLNGEFKEEEMRKVLIVGLSCTNPDSTERPSMKTVFQTLSNVADETMIVQRKMPKFTFSEEILLEGEKNRFLKESLRSDFVEEEERQYVVCFPPL